MLCQDYKQINVISGGWVNLTRFTPEYGIKPSKVH